MAFQGGGVFQKPNFLKESMALKWNFQRGWGVQDKKKPSVGGVWIFSVQNIISRCKSTLILLLLSKNALNRAMIYHFLKPEPVQIS